MGGHSGLNIHEGRGNAVQLAARTVDRILHVVPGARLVSIQGGDKRNAIAREATAELLVASSSPCSCASCFEPGSQLRKDCNIRDSQGFLQHLSDQNSGAGVGVYMRFRPWHGNVYACYHSCEYSSFKGFLQGLSGERGSTNL